MDVRSSEISMLPLVEAVEQLLSSKLISDSLDTCFTTSAHRSEFSLSLRAQKIVHGRFRGADVTQMAWLSNNVKEVGMRTEFCASAHRAATVVLPAGRASQAALEEVAMRSTYARAPRHGRLDPAGRMVLAQRQSGITGSQTAGAFAQKLMEYIQS